MSDFVYWIVFVVLALDVLLFATLTVLKTIHRDRMRHREQRRNDYVYLLSRYLAFEHPVEPIPADAAEDGAFLDAIIDLRNTVTGAEVKKLSDIARRLSLVERQSETLRRRFPRTRRLRAAVALAELGDKASAGVLLEHLEDPEDEIRIQSARGLARIGYTPAIDRIVDRLEVENAWVRARFGDSLAQFGEDASQPLMAYVTVNHAAGNTHAVVQAIHTLGVIGDYTIGPRMAQVLDLASIPEVEIAAAGALGQVGGTFALPSLFDAVHSADWRVRAKAVSAMGAIGDPEVLEPLYEALTDEAWWVRRNSAGALASMAGGVPLLYRALVSDDVFARDAAGEALEDAGELARARAHHDEGAATRDELRLLRHMRGVQVMGA